MTRFRHVTGGASLVAAVLWTAAPAWGQSAPAPAGSAAPGAAPAAPAAPSASAPTTQGPAAAAPPAQPITAGFQDGFFIQSNGDNRLVLGLVAQTDGRFSLDDPKPIVNTFTIRKIRPTFSGRVAKYFDFKVMPDFGNGTAVVQDAYFDIRFSQKFRVRTGKDKTPVGYELLEGDNFLLFPERSLASSLVPNRDIGVQIQGDLSPKLFYAAGVFNGIPDGTSASTELDTNNAKDVAGRMVVQPFRSTATPAPALSGLGFQVGASHGTQFGALPSFKTSIQQTFFSYAAGATAGGDRTRISPAIFYYYKSFGGFAEYMRSKQDVVKGGVTSPVDNHAWDVTASLLITGDTASYGLVRPRNNFDPANGHWGALQLLARYAVLSIDDAAFSAGLTGAGASREARSFTIGANWYLSSSIKIYATFERTTFGTDAAGATRKPENVMLYRTQLAF